MRSRTLVLLVLVVLVVAACGDGTTAETTTTRAQPATSQAQTTTTMVPPTTTTTLPPETIAPGEPIDIGPRAGDVLTVVGVPHTVRLDVLLAPGDGQEVVAELRPLGEDVIALGNSWALPGSIWYEVDVGGVIGWADSSFLAYTGETYDATAALVEELGELPWAPTMELLGMVVAGSLHVDSGGMVYMSGAPKIGDLGEVTFDVTGIEDDSVRGFRVHVFGTPDEEGFVLKSVEETLLCGRGVSDGLCV